MEYTSIEDIKQEFSIVSDNAMEIRKCLRLLQGEIHPDRNGGKFASREDEIKFFRIDEAIDYIESHGSRELVPLSQEVVSRSEIERIVAACINQADYSHRNISTILPDRINNTISKGILKDRIPKITSATLITLLTSIWLFPDTLSNHPVLKGIINVQGVLFSSFWLVCILTTIILWFILLIKEERKRKFLSILTFDTAKSELFEMFLSYELYLQGETVFSRSMLVDFLEKLRNTIVEEDGNSFIRRQLSFIRTRYEMIIRPYRN
ncbi:MAG: J domain-containing protein [Armatimonadota bacterium]